MFCLCSAYVLLILYAGLEKDEAKVRKVFDTCKGFFRKYTGVGA